MPAYNAEVYIAEAINSVLNQKFEDWELIITNDGSTDQTLDIVETFAKDSRIHCFTIKNSGSAKIARDYAISKATGKYVLFLDSDDYLSSDYLEITYNLIIEKGGQIILAQMLFFDEKGTVFRKLPSDEFIDRCFSGYNALRLTLPSWNIGFNGAAIERNILNRLNIDDNIKHLLNSDELDSRVYLSQADSVCISRASYYFRNNLSSTTRKFNLRNYERLITDKHLILFVKEKYLNDKDLLSATIINSIGTIKWLSSFYVKNRKKIGKQDKSKCKQLLKDQIQFVKGTNNEMSLKNHLVLVASKLILWIF